MKRVFKANALFDFMVRFIMPFMLWMYMFKSFLNGTITLHMDSYSIYSMFKFFYNNLFNGVVPLWDPFVELGVPYISIPTSGVLNPFMAIFAFLHFAGINYYISFILFILFYFIFGLAGFYLFVLEILGDRFYAWLAFIALLFSGMGPMLFNQLFIYFIFCPAVWMFYFLFRFFKKFEFKHFLGIVVTFTNMLCFYMPFYFLTVFLFFTVLLVCLYPMRLVGFAKGLKCFMIQHKKRFFSCVLFIILALLPLVFFKMGLNGKDLLFLSRRAPSENIVFSTKALNEYSESAMTFNEVSLGGTLGERIKGGRLFSHLDKYEYNSDDFFYIPELIYIIIFIAAFVSFGRAQFFILCLGLSIFLLSLGQVGPLHQILFNTVFYFKYFRNFFFFMAFLIPVIILFSMFQLKVLLDSSFSREKCWQNIIVNTFLHSYFLCFLYWHGNILMSSVVTVIVSYVFFTLLFLRPQLSKIFFFFIMVLEPIQVYASFEANSLPFKFSAPASHFTPFFSYQRPSLNQEKPFCIFAEKGSYGNLWYDLAMRDSKGYIADKPMIVSKFTYILAKTMDEKVLLDYTRYKFYIYDRTQYLGEHANVDLEDVFRKNENLVFVADPIENGMFQNDKGGWGPPLAISRATANFKVTDFNTNSIRLITDFNTKKFLVYTDSYDKNWKVFINKQEHKLYRANTAFKGVWLPAGRNEVIFQYSVMGQKELYLLILFLNFLILIYLLKVLCLK